MKKCYICGAEIEDRHAIEVFVGVMRYMCPKCDRKEETIYESRKREVIAQCKKKQERLKTR